MSAPVWAPAVSDLSADLEAALCDLERAVDFREACLQRPLECKGTGALRDAREWVDAAASKIVRIRLDMQVSLKMVQS